MPRRRAPAWVRQWTSHDLHATAGKLMKQRAVQDLSVRQEWLYDCLLNELVWRRHAAQRDHERHWCACWMCCSDLEQF
jgi:hypothetical protein